jgi:hypothetical protein
VSIRKGTNQLNNTAILAIKSQKSKKNFEKGWVSAFFGFLHATRGKSADYVLIFATL